MLVKKIMVAYDGSEDSRKGLEWALALQKLEGAALEIVMVISPVDSVSVYETHPVDMFAMWENQKSSMAEALEKIGADCVERGQPVTTRLLEGNVAETLLEHSGESGADLIVTGSRGMGGFKGLLLGSISSKLVSYAKMPVVVIK